MMNKIIKIFILTGVMYITNAIANDVSALDRYVYIGAEFGLADPIVKSFKHSTGTTIKLNKSTMYGGRVGYSFYPGMMIELSGTHRPKYKLSYILPMRTPSPAITIAEKPGSTEVASKVFMASLIYEMNKMTPIGIKPYVIFGAGISQISIKPTSSAFTPPANLVPVLGNNDFVYFKLQKHNHNRFAWQAGVGIKKDLTDDFSVDLAAKMQVVHNIKLKYQVVDFATLAFGETKNITKTIGLGEFTFGLIYKIPM